VYVLCACGTLTSLLLPLKILYRGCDRGQPAGGWRNHRWWRWRGVARGQSIKCGDNGAGHAIRVWTPLWLYFLPLLYTFYCDVIPFPYTHTLTRPTRTHTNPHAYPHTGPHTRTRIRELNTYIYKHTRICVHTAPSINLAIQFKDRVLRCINVVKSKREKNHLRYIIETALTKIRDWLWWRERKNDRIRQALILQCRPIIMLKGANIV